MKKPEGIQSVGHYVFNKLEEKFGDTILFIDAASGRHWTGRQLKDKILNVATALRDLHGFEPGTAVCISYDNSDYTLILALAIISLGGMVASAYSKDPYAELLYLAKKVEPRYLFCHANNLGWAKQLETDMGYPVTAISMDGTDTDNKHHFQFLYNYQHSQSKSLHHIPVASKDLDEDVALMLMSSGTTGKPKAIPVTHMNCVSDMCSLEDRASNRDNKVRFACSASLDYVSGRLIMFGSLAVGYTTIILEGSEPKIYLAAIERYKINIVYLGAASFYNLITYKDLEQYDISSVKIIFPMGAKIIYLEELARFFAKHPHIVQVKQGFGASELSGGAMKTMTPREYLENSECCGQLLPGMQAKLIDQETGEQIDEPNKRGMLLMRGYTMFPGYYDIGRVRAGLSKSPFIRDESVFDEEGFYKTGDIAYFNEHQELFIVGRQKETMCCRAGKKVLPQELEEIIEQHPAVSKVCVLGIENKVEKTLHCPRAFVVPKPEVAHHSLKRDDVCISNNNNNHPKSPEEQQQQLKFTGTNKLCSSLADSDELRHSLMVDIMNFVDERVGWEKQLTGGLALLDDMPTLRETGKTNKSYLRSLTLDQIEIYGDRSSF